MMQPTARVAQPAAAPLWSALAFALATLAVGMLPAGLTFALDPGAPSRIGLDVVPIPAWVFTAVWLVAYSGMGIATWLVWQQRASADVTVPLAIFGAALLQTLSFWLTDSIRMTAVIDATGVVLACTVAYVYGRYARSAVWWLLPWVVWMPITLGVKLWVLASGAA